MIAFAKTPILAFQVGDLIKLQEGTVAVAPLLPNALRRDDGSPSRAGDVLSVQPDGKYQTRPATLIGPWETARVVGDKLVFSNYEDGAVYIVPMVPL
jgi:hypothetical protein